MSSTRFSLSHSFQPGANDSTLSDLVLIAPQSSPARILRVYLAGQQAGAGNPIFRLIRRSEDDTGGTRAHIHGSEWDPTRSECSCIAYYYTAHPTAVGEQTGVYRSTPVQFDQGGLHSGIVEWQFEANGNNIVVYPGEFIAINVSGIDDAATVQFSVEFSEDHTG